MDLDNEKLGGHYEVETKFSIYDVSELVIRYEAKLDALFEEIDQLQEQNRVLREKLSKLDSLQSKLAGTPIAWFVRKVL